MRRVLCLFLIAVLAGPAVAQTAKPTLVIPPTSSRATPQSDTPALPPPLAPLTGTTQARDPEQCKASCARAYYFCRANSEDDTCPTTWTQCRARCTATYTAPALGY